MKHTKRKTRTKAFWRRVRHKGLLEKLIIRRRGRKPGKVRLRKYARGIAKARMVKAGVHNVNKNFSQNWKSYL